jgi:hypothetical protein
MKRNGQFRKTDPSAALNGHRFERLVIFYSDADGLRRGFQFWMGWPGGAKQGCGCIPIYLGDGRLRRRADEILQKPCRKALVLFCPSVSAVNADDLGARVSEIFAQDKTAQRALVVLLTDPATLAAWQWLGATAVARWFPLGTFAASRCGGSDRRNGPTGYDVRSLLPGEASTDGNTKRRMP